MTAYLRTAWLPALIGLLMLFGAALPAHAAPTETRLALVVGVGDYPARPLTNAVKDADLMARSLQEVGFTVMENHAVTNLPKGKLRTAVNDLTAKAKVAAAAGHDVTVLFYFAGHGVQFGGVNYLIPTGTSLFEAEPTEADYTDQTLAAQYVMDKLAESGASRVIIILDACRTNPFNPAERGLRAEGGLAAMGPPLNGTDALIFYASEPRRPALDDVGGSTNSPFTRALADFVTLPGLDLDEVFSSVRQRVIVLTERKQKPYFEGALIDFKFGKAERAAIATPGTAAGASQQGAGLNLNREGREVLAAALKRHPITDIQDLAQKGDGFSQWLLAIAYQQGMAVTKDDEESLVWARRAVANGVRRAIPTLGYAYNKGAGVTRDLNEARRWYEIGAERGESLSLNNLGAMYRAGEGGVEQNVLTAARNFHAAGELGLPLAKWNLAELLLEQPRNPELTTAFGPDTGRRAEALLQSVAAEGQPDALVSLAGAYAYGQGLPRDPVAANALLKTAADGGSLRGMLLLAARLDSGAGAKADPVAATALYRKAAAAGDVWARTQLAQRLATGVGAPRDPAGARQLMDQAAEGGDISALLDVAARTPDPAARAALVVRAMKPYSGSASAGPFASAETALAFSYAGAPFPGDWPLALKAYAAMADPGSLPDWVPLPTTAVETVQGRFICTPIYPETGYDSALADVRLPLRLFEWPADVMPLSMQNYWYNENMACSLPEATWRKLMEAWQADRQPGQFVAAAKAILAQ